jgi:beta-phosphoglucomutase
MMERAELLPLLDFFLSNEDVAAPKPAPDMYLAAIRRMGLQAAECLIVEDNPNGIKAARDSGAHVLCVTDVREVNHANIMHKIAELEAAHA